MGTNRRIMQKANVAMMERTNNPNAEMRTLANS